MAVINIHHNLYDEFYSLQVLGFGVDMLPIVNLSYERTNNNVRLFWCMTEHNGFEELIFQNLTGFRVYRDNVFLDMIDTSTFSFRDFRLDDGVYVFSVVAVYGDLGYSEAVCIEVTVESEIPFVTALIGNFPNPFNPVTSIRYQVSGNNVETLRISELCPTSKSLDAAHSSQRPYNSVHVQITIYNIRGQRIKTLVNDYKPAGEHSAIWNGTDDCGNQVSSGVYFYRMRAGDYQSVRRMILMK